MTHNDGPERMLSIDQARSGIRHPSHFLISSLYLFSSLDLLRLTFDSTPLTLFNESTMNDMPGDYHSETDCQRDESDGRSYSTYCEWQPFASSIQSCDLSLMSIRCSDFLNHQLDG